MDEACRHQRADDDDDHRGGGCSPPNVRVDPNSDHLRGVEQPESTVLVPTSRDDGRRQWAMATEESQCVAKLPDGPCDDSHDAPVDY